MSQLTLRFSVVEKNERGQEVELVRKALQFKPQVRHSCVKIDVNCEHQLHQGSLHILSIQSVFKLSKQGALLKGNLRGLMHPSSCALCPVPFPQCALCLALPHVHLAGCQPAAHTPAAAACPAYTASHTLQSQLLLAMKQVTELTQEEEEVEVVVAANRFLTEQLPGPFPPYHLLDGRSN